MLAKVGEPELTRIFQYVPTSAFAGADGTPSCRGPPLQQWSLFPCSSHRASRWFHWSPGSPSLPASQHHGWGYLPAPFTSRQFISITFFIKKLLFARHFPEHPFHGEIFPTAAMSAISTHACWKTLRVATKPVWSRGCWRQCWGWWMHLPGLIAPFSKSGMLVWVEVGA